MPNLGHKYSNFPSASITFETVTMAQYFANLSVYTRHLDSS